MKSKTQFLFLLVLLFLSGCSSSYTKNDQKNIISINFDDGYHVSEKPYSNTVVCKLKLSSSASKSPKAQKMEADSMVEPNFNSFTITDIDSEKPILIGNDGNRTDLVKTNFAGNDDMIYMLEVTAVGNLNIWTLFRKENILTMTKQYDLFGPYAMAEIGDCKSGLN